MSIAIVSASPQTTPAAAIDLVTATGENPLAGSDFASLLLGQLFADNTTTPRNDIAETSATEAADTESVPEATVADSPAALLVVLSQLPVEPRNATPPVASPRPSKEAL